MFNNVKVYSKVLFDDKRKFVFTDYIVQIEDSFYPCYINNDPKDYDLVLSTSSLDNLEVFILRFLMKKTKTSVENRLLNFLYLFWKEYTGLLSDSLWDYLKDNYSL